MASKLIDELSLDAFGRTRTEADEKGVCVSCGKKPESFRDKRSEKEFAITGMCQTCQDGLFGTGGT